MIRTPPHSREAVELIRIGGFVEKSSITADRARHQARPKSCGTVAVLRGQHARPACRAAPRCRHDAASYTTIYTDTHFAHVQRSHLYRLACCRRTRARVDEPSR